MKEQIYNTIADTGIWLMSTIFPEYFAKEPLRPTDRYYEYPWALRHIYLYTKPGIILDVGSAGSMFPLIIQSLGHEVHSIDIRKCQYNGVHFTQKDILESGYTGHKFDIITAISTIEHIGLKGRYGVKNDQDADIKAVREIHRILRPNGMFLASIPYGYKFIAKKYHRIYDKISINELFNDFNFEMKIIDSPEADYKIALIKAIK